MPTGPYCYQHLTTSWRGNTWIERRLGGLLPELPFLPHSWTRSEGQITECVSAFANSNREGGLLILGISSSGEIKGINHLSEVQQNSLTNIDMLLRNHAARSRLVDCSDDEKKPNRICLIYVPYSEHAICETPEARPKAWIRHGCQNLIANDRQRDQLRREKQIVHFERDVCCPYDPSELDRDVVSEFRKVFLADASLNYSDEELLFQAGAVLKNGAAYSFTNAGLLFFSANPQRLMPWAAVRLLRYEANMGKESEIGLVSLEKSFTGSLSKQIRQVRAYLQSSGFFKIYQVRNRDGGFREDPEFPLIAVDEAIVNAVAHRDYAVNLPIECKRFTDAFVVVNPGRILQRDHDVPPQFSLAELSLDHIPPNAKLLDWLKIMRDERGSAFVFVAGGEDRCACRGRVSCPAKMLPRNQKSSDPRLERAFVMSTSNNSQAKLAARKYLEVRRTRGDCCG
jgi:predicted HTH transcriptional regulator